MTAECLSVELLLHDLTTKVCRGWDSNTVPLAAPKYCNNTAFYTKYMIKSINDESVMISELRSVHVALGSVHWFIAQTVSFLSKPNSVHT